MVTSASLGLVNPKGAEPIVQYTLTVLSEHGTTSGGGQYEDGATAYAVLSVGKVSAGLIQDWVFTGWSGAASGMNLMSDPIVMDGQKTALANWTLQFNTTFYILIVVAAVAVVVVVLVFMRRR
jgi:uncharacterized repeat protein (TIGR02543 family)